MVLKYLSDRVLLGQIEAQKKKGKLADKAYLDKLLEEKERRSKKKK